MLSRRHSSSSMATARCMSSIRRRYSAGASDGARRDTHSAGRRNKKSGTSWKARHDALYASLAVRPGAKAWTTDVCVPISRLADCIMATKQDKSCGALFPIHLVGHVGDGNFHMAHILDPGNEREVAQAHELNERMIACGRSRWVGRPLASMVSATGRSASRKLNSAPRSKSCARVKRALDPENRMNPGSRRHGRIARRPRV